MGHIGPYRSTQEKKFKNSGGPLVFLEFFRVCTVHSGGRMGKKNLILKKFHKILSGGPLGFWNSFGSVLCIPVVPRGKK